MDPEIKALRSELAQLKRQFNKRVDFIESRLITLLELELELQHSEEPKQSEEQKQPQGPIEDTTFVSIQTTGQQEASTPSSPSFITTILHATLSIIFDWFSPVAKIYQSYKERGLLGIFLLTIAGIALTLVGFGYLMQLLIDQLGVGSKSLLMCIAAILVIGLGIYLKIKTRFSEFATAIVTLGILLSFSTVYFSGSVYEVLPSMLVLFLYLLIAILCHVLALWLDTKIVAGLGIIGIAMMPILSDTVQISPLYYLLSLAFVTVSSLILAYRHLGQWLANLSLAFTLVALEWIIGIEGFYVSALLVDLFYILFFSYIALSLFKGASANNQTLALLATLVGAMVLLFFQGSNLFSTSMHVSFILNAMIAAIIAKVFYTSRHQLTHFLILLAALWTVLAIVSVINNDYWGIAWAAEGILLLYIGSRYHIPAVINQGQVLTAIAIMYCWSALVVYFPLPALKSADGWMLSIVIIAAIGIWQRILANSGVNDEIARDKIKPVLQLLEVVWLSMLLIVNSNIWFAHWTGPIVIFLQLGLLFRAKHCQESSIDAFAAILILVPLYYVHSGALQVGSYRFTMLPVFAQLSLISAFIQLWLWSEFYRKYQPTSELVRIAEAARILFYMLLPVCWITTVIRRFDEDALMIIWLSPLLALYLSQKIKHQLLVHETKLLTVLASLALIVTLGELQLLYSVIALVGFSVFYVIAYFLDKQKSSQLSQFICNCGVFFFGFAIPVFVGSQTNSLLYGALVAYCYWVIAFYMLNISLHLKRNEIMVTIVNNLLIVEAWLMTPLDVGYICGPILFLLAAIYQKNIKFKNSQLGGYLGLNRDIYLHSITAITYVIFFASLSQYRLDLLIAPALAIHGALILFTKDRRIITVRYSFGLILLGIMKLELVDVANALLWQKVILFIGMGGFILTASFWYQKLVSKIKATNR